MGSPNEDAYAWAQLFSSFMFWPAVVSFCGANKHSKTPLQKNPDKMQRSPLWVWASMAPLLAVGIDGAGAAGLGFTPLLALGMPCRGYRLYSVASQPPKGWFAHVYLRETSATQSDTVVPEGCWRAPSPDFPCSRTPLEGPLHHDHDAMDEQGAGGYGINGQMARAKNRQCCMLFHSNLI